MTNEAIKDSDEDIATCVESDAAGLGEDRDAPHYGIHDTRNRMHLMNGMRKGVGNENTTIRRDRYAERNNQWQVSERRHDTGVINIHGRAGIVIESVDAMAGIISDDDIPVPIDRNAGRAYEISRRRWSSADKNCIFQRTPTR